MDPVNKWLTTIILFMIALLVVIGWKAGSGRYEMSVLQTPDGYTTVYVLDTKDGEVQAKKVDESELVHQGSPRRYPVEVFEWKSMTNYGRRY